MGIHGIEMTGIGDPLEELACSIWTRCCSNSNSSPTCTLKYGRDMFEIDIMENDELATWCALHSMESICFPSELNSYVDREWKNMILWLEVRKCMWINGTATLPLYWSSCVGYLETCTISAAMQLTILPYFRLFMFLLCVYNLGGHASWWKKVKCNKIQFTSSNINDCSHATYCLEKYSTP